MKMTEEKAVKISAKGSVKNIALLLLTGTLFISSLYSCASAADNGKDNTTAAADVTTVPEESTRIPTGLPDSDYEGYEYRILCNGPEYNVHWYAKDIDTEEENGDVINDAVYIRNRAVEELYNVKITGLPQKDPAGIASKSITAADDMFDLVSGSLSANALALAQRGMVVDLFEVNFIDLEKPWYDQLAIKELSIGGRLFAVISDLTIMDKDATWIIMFNKNMVQNFNLDDPYELVDSGSWTLEKMYSMMESASGDINGDGVYDDTDRYGLITQVNANGIGFLNGAGEYIAQKDADDLPYISMYNERSVNVMDIILKIQADPIFTIRAEDWFKKYPNDTVWNGMQLVVFNTDRGLFYYAGMNRVSLLRDMQTDFGILPTPKYETTQEAYHVMVEAWCTNSSAIPITATDLERTAVILESLTAESYYTLRPAYYDVALKTKYARDEESGRMLDIIFSSRCYDIGYVYGWGALNTLPNTLYSSKSTDFSSQFAKAEKNALKALDKTVEQYRLNANIN